ncbi:protein-export membrane protein SecD [Lachnospiraceae bacterium 28-4]|nr:protein-export membrane protein SecD [Lachnospiraceae bacterium 28-4]
MKKNKAIIVLLVMVLLLGGLSYTAVEGIGTEKAGAASGIKLGLDLAGGVSITYQVVGEENPSKEDMADTIYKLQKRVEKYSTEAQVYQEGNDRISIEIPGVSDANAILEELGKPGSLFFLSETDPEGGLNYTATMDENGELVYIMLRDISELQADGSTVLAGTDVKDARAGSINDNMQGSQFGVDLTMTQEGTKKFADATRKAYEKGESIAIYYDNEIISAPMVNAAITDGNAQITGSFTFEEADMLASTIRIGGLKLELEELRSNVVGAQLGSAAISTSLKAAAVGFGLVVIFMIAVYWLMGVAAGLALAIYTAMIVVLLNLFEITLTLPGIAGIILSIGMAVDANVIIFARIREELATGKTVQSAVKIGFEKAFSAILDGNVTTLIAALVLGFIGSGTIKGFAQTLGLGIVVSMFTALVITKSIMKAMYAAGLKKVSLYGIGKESKAIAFLSRRKVFFAVSLAIIAAGFIVMGVNKSSGGSALNYSLEFVGGTSTNVTFNEDMTIEKIDQDIVPSIEAITGDGNVQTQKVAGTNEVIFKTRTLTVAEREQFKDTMVNNFSADAEKITAETISSTISSEMQSDAVVAILVATACMLLYIWFRFKDIRFGASAVLALVHDVLVVLAFYAAAKVSVSSTFIACMLTIVGYSINATIVIFDRIRENMALMGKKDSLEDVVNDSVSKTLSRSIFTSLTTFFMVASLYIFGVTSIREFALPLMVGIVCGTYSSVCITGALWYVFRTKFEKKA